MLVYKRAVILMVLIIFLSGATLATIATTYFLCYDNYYSNLVKKYIEQETEKYIKKQAESI